VISDKLQAGARVADVGCGHGASTILMAQAFPRSEFVGFDYHDASIGHARAAAAEAGLEDDRVRF
jgi:trans-aconitate methyltransferase